MEEGGENCVDSEKGGLVSKEDSAEVVIGAGHLNV